ncbi:MAG: hypothetical protein R3A13_02795 [Bdellovibrionota bacterium]
MSGANLPEKDPGDQNSSRLSLDKYRESLNQLSLPNFDKMFAAILAEHGLSPIDERRNFVPPEKVLWLLPELQHLFSDYKNAPTLHRKLNPEVEFVGQAFDRHGVKFVLLKIEDSGFSIVPNKRSRKEAGAPSYFEKFETETRLLVRKPDGEDEVEYTPIFKRAAFKELMKPLITIGKYLDSSARPEIATPSDIPVASYLFETLIEEVENELEKLGCDRNTHLLLENIERIYVDQDKVIHFIISTGEYGPEDSSLFGSMGVQRLHLKLHAGLHRLGTLHTVCIDRKFLKDQDFIESKAA